VEVLKCFLFALPIFGQQTIFNVPSADIAVKTDWFFQHQTTTRVWNPGRSWVQTNAFGYGIGHSIELDATLFNLDVKDAKDSTLSVGFKASVPLLRNTAKMPLRLVVGDMFEFTERPLDNTRLRNPHEGNWAYVMLNTELPRLKTRLTGGLTDGTKVLFGQRANGFLGGLEQPLSNRWTFQVDWFSGHHELAYWIPGVVYRFRERWMLSLGLQVPNRTTVGSRAIIVELTRF
jgi:hypothetical protein